MPPTNLNPVPPQYLTGAIPSPPHRAFAAEPFQARVGAPTSWSSIPPKLSVWGNNKFGDCVTAEEAFAKACYSVAAGLGEIFVTEAEVVSWARRHGHLNGATLTDVMDDMQRDGIVAEDGKTYTDGNYKGVDWSDDAVLSSAIFTGPVKIAVASGQLVSALNTTKGRSGWFLLNAKRNHNSDHCVSLCGYGTVAECAQMLGVQPPAGSDAATRAYLLFTWGTIGVVSRESLLAICTEAWIRTPTTPEQPAPNPEPGPPPPGPTPTPVPGGTVSIDLARQVVTAPPGWTLKQGG